MTAIKENTSIRYLSNEIEKSINHFSKRSRINRIKTGGNKICAVVFSALITMVLGLQAFGPFDSEQFATFQTNFALLLGFALTLVNGIDMIFSYKKLWIRNERTLYNLQIIEKKVNYAITTGNCNEEKVSMLFQEYVHILENSSNNWLDIYKDDQNLSTVN